MLEWVNNTVPLKSILAKQYDRQNKKAFVSHPPKREVFDSYIALTKPVDLGTEQRHLCNA